MTTWADLLHKLPTIKQSESDGTLLLKVKTDSMRVWLCEDEGCANGNPFPRTVYVEDASTGFWQDVGYFDGDEEDPQPTGLLGDAYALTLTA